jgi:two-component system, NarL family, response regulator DevR
MLPTDTTRVLIVDDHLVVRQGLRSLLSQYSEIEVVGEAAGGPAVLEQIGQLEPDVILLDIRLGNSSGLDLARHILRLYPEMHILVLTSYDEEAYLLEAAQAGVHGYLLKSASAELLAEAIRAVHAGERRLSSDLGGKALAQLAILSRTQALVDSRLSDQELQLLQLIAQGAANQEIAQHLYWSERTVKRKLQDVLEKLGASSRAQAVAEGYKRGLL